MNITIEELLAIIDGQQTALPAQTGFRIAIIGNPEARISEALESRVNL